MDSSFGESKRRRYISPELKVSRHPSIPQVGMSRRGRFELQRWSRCDGDGDNDVVEVELAELVEVSEEEEEEIDTMQGLKDLTKGIREMALKEREEIKQGLLETDEEAKARIK